ncbi:zymogen granule membrane glycoprotein [Pelomyxa schiedti]|nr:zymogen granule membrane glycoprotein [Pelomyxa schiedti]
MMVVVLAGGAAALTCDSAIGQYGYGLREQACTSARCTFNPADGAVSEWCFHTPLDQPLTSSALYCYEVRGAIKLTSGSALKTLQFKVKGHLDMRALLVTDNRTYVLGPDSVSYPCRASTGENQTLTFPPIYFSAYKYYFFSLNMSTSCSGTSEEIWLLWAEVGSTTFVSVPLDNLFIAQNYSSWCDQGICEPEILSVLNTTKASGGQLRISGNWLPPCDSVSVGDISCGSINTGDGKHVLTCQLGEGSPGVIYNMSIVCKGVSSNTSTVYRFSAPTIQSVSPTIPTQGGTMLYIAGDGFGPPDTNLCVRINGTICDSPQTIDQQAVTCYPRPGAGSQLRVSVGPCNNQSDWGYADIFNYEAPSISTAKIIADPPRLDITGANFGPSSIAGSVSIAGAPCTKCTKSHTSITCTPPLDGCGLSQLLCVEIPSGSNITACSNINYPPPTIQSATLSNSCSSRNTTINGMWFGKFNTSIEVSVNSFPCANVSVHNYNQITCNPPVGLGVNLPVQVTVRTGGDQSSPVANVFSYTSPAITSNIPKPNSVGELVYLIGTDLCQTSSLLVTIGGASAGYPSVINSSLVQCSAPPGGGSAVEVCIATYCSNTFTYLGPNISSIDGLLPEGCSNCTIHGYNFGTATTTLVVRLDGTEVPSIWESYTSVKAALLVGSGNHTITVSVGGLTSPQFHISFSVPAILNTTSADTDGSTETIITGQNFGAIGTPVTVSIAGNDCRNARITVANTQIRCFPVGIGVNLTMNVSISGSTLKWDKFCFSGPVAYSASPLNYQANTIIQGRNFGFFSTPINVTIGGEECSNAHVIVEHTQISCTPKPGVGQNIKVVIVVLPSTNNSAVTYFSYDNPIIVKTTSPPSSGGRINITGKGFGAKNSSVSVYIGALNCSDAEVISQEEIQCSAPMGVGKNNTLTVKLASGTVIATSVIDYDEPTIGTSTRCNTTGNITITISGTNFGPPGTLASVSIGNKTCINAQSVNHNQITCLAPPGAGSQLLLCVTIPRSSTGQTTCDYIFSYNPPAVLSATSSDPHTFTSISGMNFGPPGTSVTAFIAGRECVNVTVLSHTSLKCVTPDGIGTNQLVEVYVPVFGSQNASASVFSYAAPQIIQMEYVPTTGSTSFRIKGSNFGPDSSATILASIDGNSSWVKTSWLNENFVECPIPSGSGLNHTISVNVAGQKSKEYLFSYKYPQIETVSSANTDQSTEACIFGTNLGPSGTHSEVKIGTSTWTTTTSASDTRICFKPPEGVGVNLTLQLRIYATRQNQTVTYKGFSYQAPVISLVSTANCCTESIIHVYGTNFGPIGTPVNVSVRNAPCRNSSVSSAHRVISCVPAVGVGRLYPVRISIPGYTVQSDDAFSYSVPTIVAIGTFTDEHGNVKLRITGTNFGPEGTVVTVTTNTNKSCNSPQVTVNCTEIQCLYATPSQPVNYLQLTVPASSTHSQTIEFLNMSIPSPILYNASTTTTKGGEIYIYGENMGYTGATLSVTIDGHICDSAQVDIPHSRIKCSAQAGVGASLLVIVKVLYGTSTWQQGMAYIFSYAAPTIKAVSDVSTTGGGITINGTNFGDSVESIFLSVNSKACDNVQFVTPHTSVQCQVTPGVGANLPVKLRVGNQLTEAMIFHYKAPVIIGTDPVPTAGSLQHIIMGQNFGPGGSYVLKTLVDTAWVPSQWVSHTEILANFTPGVGAHLPLMVNVADQISAMSEFRFSAPSITSTSSVKTDASEKVVINGTNFGTESNLLVTITGDNIPCVNCECKSATVTIPHTQITCFPPAGAGSNNTVIVILPLGSHNQSGVFEAFSFSKPVIFNISSTNTPGNFTTIHGSNFGPLGTPLFVTIENRVCTSPTTNLESSHIQITCLSPPGYGSLLDVMVQVAGIKSDIYPIFSYNKPVVLSANIDSKSDTELENPKKVTVGGSNFGPIGSRVSVTINGTDCSNASVVVNHTSVSCYTNISAGANLTVEVCAPPSTQQCGSSPVFSYFAPEIAYVPQISTTGGFYVITGHYFAVGSFYPEQCIVDGIPQITYCINSTAVSCFFPALSGRNHSLVIAVSGQHSLPFLFSYQAPIITSASRENELTVILGYNFGPKDTQTAIFMSVFGNDCGFKTEIECTNATVIIPHTKITCYTPPATGSDVEIELFVPIDSSQTQIGYFPNFSFAGHILPDLNLSDSCLQPPYC